MCSIHNGNRLHIKCPSSSFWLWYIYSVFCLCWACVCTGRCVCPVFIWTGYQSVLGQASRVHTKTPQLNSNRTSVVRCGRQRYERLYPVMLVRPDGATVNIRYKEPRRILMVSIPFPSLSAVSVQCFLIATDL